MSVEDDIKTTRLVRVARRLGKIEVGDTQARIELRSISNDPDLITRAAARIMAESALPEANSRAQAAPRSSAERALRLLGAAGADLERASSLAAVENGAP